MRRWYTLTGLVGILVLVFSVGGCSSKSSTDKQDATRRGAIGKQGAKFNKRGKHRKRRKHKRRVKNRKRAGEKEISVVLPFVNEQPTLSASHILITYKGADRAAPDIPRTKEDALKRAQEALKKVREGADFAAVAREYSECTSKNAGGDLGAFRAADMFPDFSKAAFKLAVNQVSEPVESPSGYHIIKRQDLKSIYTRHILVMHKESKWKFPGIKRTRKEALKIIEKVQVEIKKPDADFTVLARRYSDCMSKKCGGNLKPIGRLGVLPQFEEAAFKLKEWEVSGIVDTKFGFHIIQRIP